MTTEQSPKELDWMDNDSRLVDAIAGVVEVLCLMSMAERNEAEAKGKERAKRNDCMV